MVTIDQLTVTVTVEGESGGEEVAFARLFNKYIALWQREMQRHQALERQSQADRSLGDGGEGGR